MARVLFRDLRNQVRALLTYIYNEVAPKSYSDRPKNWWQRMDGILVCLACGRRPVSSGASIAVYAPRPIIPNALTTRNIARSSLPEEDCELG